MRAIRAACGRARTLEGSSLFSVFAVVINVETWLLAECLIQEPLWADPAGLIGHFALFTLLGTALFVWMAGYLMGLVSASTGAGFRISCLGILGRLIAGPFPTIQGIESDGRSVYDAFPSIGAIVWIGRNIGLAAFAYGLVFVALSCWSERRLRRTAPAWVQSIV